MDVKISYDEYRNMINNNIMPDVPPTELDECFMVTVLGMLQGKWKNQILFTMYKHGVMRFGELKKEWPQITSAMLSSTLRELEEDGLIIRKQFNEIPPHVEYSLTQKGEDLMPIYYEIFKWGVTHLCNNQ